MRAAHRLVLIAAAAVALAWTAAQGVGPTPGGVGRPASRPLSGGTSRGSGPPLDPAAAARSSGAARGGALLDALPPPGALASEGASAAQARLPAPSQGEPDAFAPHAGSSAAWPSLAPVARMPGVATVTVEGRDPAAPRALVLWRIEDGHAARLASARSGPNGHVSFGEVALPSSAFELAATPKGVTADGALSARSTTIPPAERVAPQVEAQPDGAGTWRLRVRLETPGGWLVVSTLDDVEIGRAPVPLAASAARTGLDLWIDDVGTIGTVLITHDDGKTGRSASRRVALIAKDAEGEGR